jgi:hypothetical protein
MAICHNDIMTAMLMNDASDACLYLRTKAPINGGSLVTEVFKDFDWPTADLMSREAKLREYIAAEMKAYSDELMQRSFAALRGTIK